MNSSHGGGNTSGLEGYLRHHVVSTSLQETRLQWGYVVSITVSLLRFSSSAGCGWGSVNPECAVEAAAPIGAGPCDASVAGGDGRIRAEAVWRELFAAIGPAAVRCRL